MWCGGGGCSAGAHLYWQSGGAYSNSIATCEATMNTAQAAGGPTWDDCQKNYTMLMTPITKDQLRQ
jgi:hypothetical protein